MKKGKLWISLLLSGVLAVGPWWSALPGNHFLYSTVGAEEETGQPAPETETQTQAETATETETETEAPIQTNEISGWPQGSSVQCDAAICFDANTGTVLYGKNIDKQEYPASITKVMTVLLALEYGKLDDVVTFSENAVYSIEYGSAHLGMTEGEQLTLEQCLYGIMLASANEISNAVAEHIGGSVEGFADMMNQKAAELGCINSHFVNPNGLHDDNHYVCAYDMALITQAAMKYDKFREIISTKEYSYPKTNLVDEERYFSNHHAMLVDEGRAYEGFIGGKTGYTDEAYNTLVSTAERDGRLLISVVLHCPGQESEYGDTVTVLDYGFNNFTEQQVNNAEVSKDTMTISGIDDAEELAKIQAANLTQAPFTMGETTTVVLPKDANTSQLTSTLDFTTGKLTYYFSGQKVGQASFTYTGNWEPETEAPTETESQSASAVETETETESFTAGLAEKVLGSRILTENKVLGALANGYEQMDEFIKEHTVMSVLIGAFLLLIFVPLLIISAIRNNKYKQMVELRMQELELRKQLEAEIEEKSAAQVEAELRAHDLELQLEEERKKKQAEEVAETAANPEQEPSAEREAVKDSTDSGENGDDTAAVDDKENSTDGEE